MGIGAAEITTVVIEGADDDSIEKGLMAPRSEGDVLDLPSENAGGFACSGLNPWIMCLDDAPGERVLSFVCDNDG